MKFNPTFLEILVFLPVYLLTTVWTKHGRKIRRWLYDYFRLQYAQCKHRYGTPVIAAKLVRCRWSVRDLLQLSVPDDVWLDTFPATKSFR